MLTTGPNTEIRFLQADPDYRKHPGTSQSELKEVLRSPAHWLARYGPNAEPVFPTLAMTIGIGLHCKTLEPEAFDKSFVDRSSKPKDPTVAELRSMLDDQGVEYKKTAKKDELEALAFPDGKPVDKRTSLAPEDFRTVCGMADALRTHETAGVWFDPGQDNYRRHNEVSLYVDNWEPDGSTLKARIDRLIRTETGWQILDLKSTDDARPEAFQRKAFNLGYHVQAAFYTDMVARVMDCDPVDVEFVFVTVERKAPHGISLFRAEPDLLEFGRAEYKRALIQLAHCRATGKFGAYPGMIQALSLPRWANSATPAPVF